MGTLDVVIQNKSVTKENKTSDSITESERQISFVEVVASATTLGSPSRKCNQGISKPSNGLLGLAQS